MAEIKIEKKSPIWPWILLAALVVAAIIYFVMASDDDGVDDDVQTEQVAYDDDGMDDVDDNDDYGQNNMESGNEDSMDGTVANYDQAIQEYSNHIGATGNMEIDHKYSYRAMTLLINAIEAKAYDLDVNLDADLEMAREKAKEVTEDPMEVDHADLIKSVGGIVTNALTTLKNQNFPNLDSQLKNVKDNLAKIETSTKTLDQKSDVNGFFKAAESLLNQMN